MITYTSLMSRDYEELLRPKDVAKIFNISVKTLWEWQKRGIIRAVRLPTGKLRYPKSEVERLWRQLRATESQQRSRKI
ncbi:MAG: helix-turn-helix domain-containing protein [Sulfolobales archaeon]